MAVLSHELRTPLNPVLMTVADLERDATVPAQVRKQMTLVRRNVELEARLIDDLLDSTRIANGKLQLQRTVVDARELLRRATAIVESEASSKDVQPLGDHLRRSRARCLATRHASSRSFGTW